MNTRLVSPKQKQVSYIRLFSSMMSCKDCPCQKILKSIVPVHGLFSNLSTTVRGLGIDHIDAALFDLGASSMQFDETSRGFSLSSDGPLDMRMSHKLRSGNGFSTEPTAAQVLNSLPGRDLARIFRIYGEELASNKIARAIEERRFTLGPIHSTKELADIVAGVMPKRSSDSMGRYSHSATRVFQALRIFVNDELNEILRGLAAVATLLRVGGRCAVITFHSLEDRIVKRIFSNRTIEKSSSVMLTSSSPSSGTASWNLLKLKDNNDFIVPSNAEIQRNPRSRSAKLRIAERIL